MKKLPGLLVAFGFLFLITAAIALIDEGNDKVNDYYSKNALQKTGSANAVNAIVWDFRSYDTLGEETVLFTTIVAVFLVSHKKGLAEEEKTV